MLVSHQMSVMSEGEGEIVPVNFMKAYGEVVVLLGEVRGCGAVLSPWVAKLIF